MPIHNNQCLCILPHLHTSHRAHTTLHHLNTNLCLLNILTTYNLHYLIKCLTNQRLPYYKIKLNLRSYIAINKTNSHHIMSKISHSVQINPIIILTMLVMNLMSKSLAQVPMLKLYQTKKR